MWAAIRPYIHTAKMTSPTTDVAPDLRSSHLPAPFSRVDSLGLNTSGASGETISKFRFSVNLVPLVTIAKFPRKFAGISRNRQES